MTKILDLLWRAGWIVLFELHLLPSVPRATPEIRERRLATCHSCPIFVPLFSRCGYKRVKDPQTGHDVRLGCGCLMEVKAKIADSRCWARVQGMALGWADEIDGKSEK